MRRLVGPVLAVVLAALLAVPGSLLAQEPAGGPDAGAPDGELATVVKVIDGDTIRVERPDGQRERVRYIGIDTPEMDEQDERASEPYSGQARLANDALVGGQDVILEADTRDRDDFGRLLRYVWVETEDGWVLVNQRLAELGLATARSYEPDTRRDGELRRAQDEAILNGRGRYDPAALNRGLVGAEAMAYLFADAYEARDVAMLRRLMHPDVVYIPPDGERFRGKAAVIARFREEWAVLDPSVTIRRSIAQPQIVLVDLTINIATPEGPPVSRPVSRATTADGGFETIKARALQRWPNDRLVLYRLMRDD